MPDTQKNSSLRKEGRIIKDVIQFAPIIKVTQSFESSVVNGEQSN